MLEPSDAPAAPPDGSGAMFDHIALRYDLLNGLMSFGLDRLWRRRLVRSLMLPPNARVLDVATGTADVALHIAREHSAAQVIGLDPSAKMLQVGRHKVGRAGAQARVTLVQGDGQALPFADNSFDAVCISFGIRNVPDRPAGMREMVRVCRPGGRVAVLELGEPSASPIAPLARFHVHTVVPLVGRLFSRHGEYRYLQRSIAAFMPPPLFVRLCAEAGLMDVVHRRMSFGSVNLFVGRA